MATTHPNLALDWNYGRNDGLLPTDIKAGSNKKVWWKCHICGHEWETIVANRKKGRGCPNCHAEKRSIMSPDRSTDTKQLQKI